MMKKIVIIFLFSGVIYGQVGYVNISHQIYPFLERMQTAGIISGYDSFELPKSRKEIGKWLRQCKSNKSNLDEVDVRILKDFLHEFALETGSERYYESFIDNPSVNYFYNQNEKYFYSYIDDSTETNYFINLLGDFTNINRRDINSALENSLNANTVLFNFGGIIRGTFYDKIGFELFASNGSFFGSRELANLQGENKFSYKFNFGKPDNSGTDFSDRTAGFITYQNDWLQLKLGRDKNLIGFGIVKDVLSDNSTYYDYFSLKFNYKAFSYTFMHARLLGEMVFRPDSLAGSIKEVGIKNFVYHRFSLSLGKTVIGAGETVIYNDRSIDLSYLNPFNFYKSAEHANQDRDNSMLFFDVQNYSIPNVKLFASLIIDDMDFSKFGTSWLGNITIFNAGIYTTVMSKYLPLDMELQYMRIDPYAYTHRIAKNNYTNFGAALGAPLEPNSSSVIWRFFYTPHNRLWITFTGRYTVHGQNYLQSNGNIVNNGGDINLGYRAEDLPDAKFLSGPKEITRYFNFHFSYQPIKNYFILAGLDYVNTNSLKGESEYLETKMGVTLSF